MIIASNLENLRNFGAQLGHQKVKKPLKTNDLSASFGNIEVALEDSTFEEVNDFQMHKLKMFQKLDMETFPMSYLGLNLAKRKASKISCEVALRTWLVELRIEPVFSEIQISPSFSIS